MNQTFVYAQTSLFHKQQLSLARSKKIQQSK